jgi:hypothetical protein
VKEDEMFMPNVRFHHGHDGDVVFSKYRVGLNTSSLDSLCNTKEIQIITTNT